MEKMKFADDMDEIFDELKDLTILQRYTLKNRYRFLMKEYKWRCLLYSALFYSFRILMTVGSLTVPALLSIQQSSEYNNMYWLTWSISLAVTTANGITTLFRLDKQFFTLHATAERLRSETWQYVQLSGRYSGHHGHHAPTHANQFVFYCSQLEKINLKRVNDEYVKSNEENHGAPPSVKQQPQTDMSVPSPPEIETPECRKDSMSVVEDAKDKKDTVILQVSGSDGTPVSQTSVAQFALLPESPKMQGKSSFTYRTDFQSGPL
jgi:hypothetical protein